MEEDCIGSQCLKRTSALKKEEEEGRRRRSR
jgi:hypothetical protein